MGLFDGLKNAFSGSSPLVGNGYNQPPYYNQGLPDEQIRVMDLLRRHPGYTDEQLNRDAFGEKMSLAGVHQWREKAEAALTKYYGDDWRGTFALQPVVSQSGKIVPLPKGNHQSTSTMTQEQLRTRRMNLIESSKFGRPAHENFMLAFLKVWLIVGPIAFVLLTSSEVAYVLTRLVAPGDTASYVIAGGALFIDLAMMFVTFGVAIKRRDLSEKREVNGSVPKREEFEVWFGTLLWLIFALINIISQSAFLLHIIGSTHDNVLYLFIAARVAGFILGDASTAFFLAKVDNTPLKLIARAEREKGKLYKDIAEAEGERQTIEARSEADILLIQIEVQGKREEAEFMAELKRQMFTQVLGNRSASRNLDGPNKSSLRRLDS